MTLRRIFAQVRDLLRYWRHPRRCAHCGAEKTFLQPYADGEVYRECDACGHEWRVWPR